LIAQALTRAEPNELPKIMLQLRGGDYKDYFDFIFLTLASISYKLTEKNIRENEFTYHLRFTTINGALLIALRE